MGTLASPTYYILPQLFIKRVDAGPPLFFCSKRQPPRNLYRRHFAVRVVASPPLLGYNTCDNIPAPGLQPPLLVRLVSLVSSLGVQTTQYYPVPVVTGCHSSLTRRVTAAFLSPQQLKLLVHLARLLDHRRLSRCHTVPKARFGEITPACCLACYTSCLNHLTIHPTIHLARLSILYFASTLLSPHPLPLVTDPSPCGLHVDACGR